MSKQFAALEHAMAAYMVQLEGGSGGSDHNAVIGDLLASMSSSQTQVCRPSSDFHSCPFTVIRQNAAAAMIERDYNDNLKRIVLNLQKHTSNGDDDEVCVNPRALRFSPFKSFSNRLCSKTLFQSLPFALFLVSS
jgi:hypothetical protein